MSRTPSGVDAADLLRNLAQETEREAEGGASGTSGTEEGAEGGGETAADRQLASWRATLNPMWEEHIQKITVFEVKGTMSQVAHHSPISRHPTAGGFCFTKGAAVSGGHTSRSCSFKQLFTHKQIKELLNMDFRVTGIGVSEAVNRFPFPVALFLTEVKTSPAAQVTHTTWEEAIHHVKKCFQQSFSMDVSVEIIKTHRDGSESDYDEDYSSGPFTLSLNIEGMGEGGSVEKKKKLSPGIDEEYEKGKEEGCSCPAPEPKSVAVTCLGVWDAFSEPKLPSRVFNSISDADDHGGSDEEGGGRGGRSRSRAAEEERREDLSNRINRIVARGEDFFDLADGIVGENDDHVIVPYGSPIWELFNQRGPGDDATTAEIYKQTALLDIEFAEAFGPRGWNTVREYLAAKNRNAEKGDTVMYLNKKKLGEYLEAVKSPHSKLSKSWLERIRNGSLSKDRHWRDAEENGQYRVVLMDRIEVYFVLGFFLKNKECLLNAGDITAFLVRLDSPSDWNAQGDMTPAEYQAAREGSFGFCANIHLQTKTTDLALELQEFTY